jgi:hypothetical protein
MIEFEDIDEESYEIESSNGYEPSPLEKVGNEKSPIK